MSIYLHLPWQYNQAIKVVLWFMDVSRQKALTEIATAISKETRHNWHKFVLLQWNRNACLDGNRWELTVTEELLTKQTGSPSSSLSCHIKDGLLWWKCNWRHGVKRHRQDDCQYVKADLFTYCQSSILMAHYYVWTIHALAIINICLQMWRTSYIFRWILKPFMYFPIDPAHRKKYRLIRRRLMVYEHD